MNDSARRKAAGCLAAVLLLGGCAAGGGDAPTAEELRAHYQQMQTVTARIQLTAVAEETEYSFKLSYDKTGETEWITVLEPKEIEGITVTFEEGKLIFPEGSVLLASGSGLSGGVSPAEALPALWRTLTGDIPTEEGTEKLDGLSAVALTYEEQAGDVSVSRRIVIDRATKAPLRAEIAIDGVRAVDCEFLSFDYT